MQTLKMSWKREIKTRNSSHLWPRLCPVIWETFSEVHSLSLARAFVMSLPDPKPRMSRSFLNLICMHNCKYRCRMKIRFLTEPYYVRGIYWKLENVGLLMADVASERSEKREREGGKIPDVVQKKIWKKLQTSFNANQSSFQHWLKKKLKFANINWLKKIIMYSDASLKSIKARFLWWKSLRLLEYKFFRLTKIGKTDYESYRVYGWIHLKSKKTTIISRSWKSQK